MLEYGNRVMAYVDHAAAFLAGIAPVSVPADVSPSVATPGFSPLEWSVILLARKDPLSSVAAPGRFVRLLRRVFGRARQPGLADPRLEALRRTAVQAWHRGYQLPVSQMKAFLAAGFTAEQLEALLGRVSAARRPTRAGA